MYNFNENLFILSENKIDINIAIKEWSILDVIFKKKIKDSNSIISKLSKKRITNEPVKCICQRNIHHYKILFNTITKEKINIGTGCIKKFKFNKKTKISKFCENMINTLGYDKIDDVILYSNDIETEIAEYIKNCFTLIEKKNLSLKEQIKTYEDLETEIKFISMYFKDNFLNSLLISIENLIVSLKYKEQSIKEEEERIKIQIEEMKKWQEQKRKEQEELKMEEEQLKKKEEEYERLEKEKKIIEKQKKYKPCITCKEYCIYKTSTFYNCFKCNTKNKELKTNKCSECNTPKKDDKYNKCFKCNEKERINNETNIQIQDMNNIDDK